MIEYDKLIPSNTNFYDLSELELLSDDIERQGLKQNLVVIENESNKGTFFIDFIDGNRLITSYKPL